MKIFMTIFIFFFSTSTIGQINSYAFDCNFTASNEIIMHNNGIIFKKLHKDSKQSYRLSIRPEANGFILLYPSIGKKEKGLELTKYTTLSNSRTSINRTFLFDTTLISIYSYNPLDVINPKYNTYTSILSQHLSGIEGPRALQEYGYCISK